MVICLFLYKLFLFFIPKEKKIITPLSNNPSSLMNISQKIASASPKVTSIPQLKTNILLVGLDGRLGDKNPRCDAIHIITVDPPKRRVQITSIPRGTLVNLGDEGMNYISNSCHLKGFDFTLKKIEQITSLTPDYVIKIGFSQSMGILKKLGFQPVATLEFLRNRRYGIGDHQRSHNQALFIKDILTTKLSLINNLPKTVKYLLLKMTDTNLDFEKASQILDQVINFGVDQNSDRVTLITKPFRNLFVKDIHYDVSIAASDNLQNSDYLDYQKLVSSNLENIITKAEKLISEKNNESAFKLVQTPFEQQFWRQIDDKNLGFGYYYHLLRILSLTSPDKKNMVSQVLDFMTEMENSGDEDYQIKAKQLLETLNI